MNLREFWERRAAEGGDRIYLYFQEQEITYRELDRRANQVANGFREQGVRMGDRVCLCLPNCPEYLYLWFGLNKIGAVMVPLNTALKETELAYIVSHSGARALVLDDAPAALWEGVKKACPALEKVYLLRRAAPGTCFFPEWLKGQKTALSPVPLAEEADAVYVYTSGTTGKPKGVMLSHLSYRLTGETYAHMAEFVPADRVMTANPLYHINAQAYSVMGTLAAGASLILIDKFSASRLWPQAKHYRATKLVLLLAITHILYNRPSHPQDRDHSVQKVIAGGAPKDHFRDFERRFGVRLQTIYSLTESPLGIMSPRGGEARDGGLGVPMENPGGAGINEIRIVDGEGQELPHLATGEIVIRNPAMMKGYFQDPLLTHEAIRQGWFHTGDSGYRDEGGYFFFRGRLKDIIRRKGENISALEVETVINSHPAVGECAVIGVTAATGFGDEEVKACVVLKAGTTLPPAELITFLAASLADFKLPRYIEYRADLPKNATGRVTKEALKKERADLTVDCYDREKGI